MRKLLFIQAEYIGIEPSLAWAYSVRGDLINSLSTFFEIDVLYSTESCHLLEKWCTEKEYSYIFINDISHLEYDNDLSLPLNVLLEQKNKGVKIIGNSIETILHNNKILEHIYYHRLQKFEKYKFLYDLIICNDYLDSELMKKMNIKTLYRPFSLSEEFFNLNKNIDKKYELLFLGTLYPLRSSFIKRSEYLSQITLGNLNYSSDELIIIQQLKNSLKKISDISSYNSISKNIELIRKNYFIKMLNILSSSKIILNLPSIFKGIPCRVVESFFANTIFLSNIPRTSHEVNLMKNSNKCFFYDENDISDFDAVIKNLKETDVNNDYFLINKVFTSEYCSELMSKIINKL